MILGRSQKANGQTQELHRGSEQSCEQGTGEKRQLITSDFSTGYCQTIMVRYVYNSRDKLKAKIQREILNTSGNGKRPVLALKAKIRKRLFPA